MNRLFAVVLLGCAATAWAADEEAAKKTVAIPGGATLEVAAPEGWSLRVIQPDPKLPPTIRLKSAKREANLQVTFFIDKVGSLGTKDKLSDMVEAAAKQQYLIGSVEKKVTVQFLDSPNAICAYAEFTDADLVGKEAKLGQYKVVATGIIKFGDTIGVVTLLGNSFDDPAYQAAKGFLKSGLTVRK